MRRDTKRRRMEICVNIRFLLKNSPLIYRLFIVKAFYFNLRPKLDLIRWPQFQGYVSRQCMGLRTLECHFTRFPGIIICLNHLAQLTLFAPFPQSIAYVRLESKAIQLIRQCVITCQHCIFMFIVFKDNESLEFQNHFRNANGHI